MNMKILSAINVIYIFKKFLAFPIFFLLLTESRPPKESNFFVELLAFLLALFLACCLICFRLFFLEDLFPFFRFFFLSFLNCLLFSCSLIFGDSIWARGVSWSGLITKRRFASEGLLVNGPMWLTESNKFSHAVSLLEINVPLVSNP